MLLESNATLPVGERTWPPPVVFLDDPLGIAVLALWGCSLVLFPTRGMYRRPRNFRACMSLACFAIVTAFCVNDSSQLSASFVFRSPGPSSARKMLYASRILLTARLGISVQC